MPAGLGRQARPSRKLCGAGEVDRDDARVPPILPRGQPFWAGLPVFPGQTSSRKKSSQLLPLPPVLLSRRLRAKGPVLGSSKCL